MKSNQFFLMLVFITLICVTSTMLFYSFYVVEDLKVIPMDIVVSDHYGFNLDTDAMHFGMTTSPGSTSRALNISQKGEHPLMVDIKTDGDIGDWVYPDDNGFVLEPGIIKEVMLTINVPENIDYGQYNGTIKVFFKRVI